MEDLKKLTLQNWTKQTNGGGGRDQEKAQETKTHSFTHWGIS